MRSNKPGWNCLTPTLWTLSTTSSHRSKSSSAWKRKSSTTSKKRNKRKYLSWRPRWRRYRASTSLNQRRASHTRYRRRAKSTKRFTMAHPSWEIPAIWIVPKNQASGRFCSILLRSMKTWSANWRVMWESTSEHRTNWNFTSRVCKPNRISGNARRRAW